MAYGDTVKLEGKQLAVTEKAIKFDLLLIGEVWIPKSQISEVSDPDENGASEITVTMWWAKKNGYY